MLVLTSCSYQGIPPPHPHPHNLVNACRFHSIQELSTLHDYLSVPPLLVFLLFYVCTTLSIFNNNSFK